LTPDVCAAYGTNDNQCDAKHYMANRNGFPLQTGNNANRNRQNDSESPADDNPDDHNRKSPVVIWFPWRRVLQSWTFVLAHSPILPAATAAGNRGMMPSMKKATESGSMLDF
jgi:hypothetical protein